MTNQTHNSLQGRKAISRRTAIGVGLGAITGAAALRYAPVTAFDRPWRPSDGVRIAGSGYGLQTLDPALVREAPVMRIVRQVFRGLMSYDLSLDVVPELAESVTVDDRNQVYAFTLRPNASFQDGRTITATDVAASLNRSLSPTIVGVDASALTAPSFLADIVGAADVLGGVASALAGVEVIDDRRLTITLEAPSTTFLSRLATPAASIVDTSADMRAPEWWRTANGSGPYAIAQAIGGLDLRLSASDSWHAGAPGVTNVAFRIDPEAASPENLFQAGEVDLVDGVRSALLPLLVDPATGIDHAQRIDNPGFELEFIMLGTQSEPLDDPAIREALCAVFDVEAYVSASTYGLEESTGSIIPDGVLDRDWVEPIRSPDLDSARAAIVRSNYGSAADVPTIRLSGADVSPLLALKDVAESELGLSVEVTRVAWSDFLNGLSLRQFAGFSLSWVMDYPDPEAILGMLWRSASDANYTGYVNEDVDRMLRDADLAQSEDDRAELYAQAQRRVLDDYVVIPLVSRQYHTLARVGMQSVPVTSMGLMGLEKLR